VVLTFLGVVFSGVFVFFAENCGLPPREPQFSVLTAG